MSAQERKSASRQASDAARELVDAADLILKALEAMEDDEAQGRRVDLRVNIGDAGAGLGAVESCASRINTHLNGVVLRLGDKDSQR